jgi:hypothetical protein
MLPALLDGQRRTLLRLGVAASVASLIILPLTDMSPVTASAGMQIADGVKRLPNAPLPLSFPPIPLDRDPFVADADAQMPLQGDRGRIDEAGTAAVLRAVVTGTEPRALVELGSTVRVVGIGDRLGGATVTAITRTGLLLSSGIELPLVSGNV